MRHLFLLLPLFIPADGETPPAPPPPPPPLHHLNLPVFVHSRLPLLEKERLSPARGTGQEPVPEPVRSVLLPAPPSGTGPPGAAGESVTTACGLHTLQVRVQRSVLGSGEADSQVKLGTCGPTESTREYLYFEYDLDMCGTRRTISNDQVIYSNVLHYEPSRVQGLIRRAVPFTLPVSCHYNRYHYSYKIGYTPKVRIRKLFKQMKNRDKFTLTPRNAQWERIFQSDQYMLGEPMYFEAEASSLSPDERLYVLSCYVTAEKSHTSTPRYPVVENFGCMVESKDGRSIFIPYKNNAVRFSVDAFLFKGMTGQLYLHCSMSVGSSVPTPVAKSCNYDTGARRWVELYGSDSVCTCCDSSCSSAPSTEMAMVRSKPWKIKPTTALKRKKVTTTTTTAPAPRRLEKSRVGTEPRTTWQPEGTGKVVEEEEVRVEEVEELLWPSGHGRVQWIEVNNEQKVTEPKSRTVFEDIFVFDK